MHTEIRFEVLWQDFGVLWLCFGVHKETTTQKTDVVVMVWCQEGNYGRPVLGAVWCTKRDQGWGVMVRYAVHSQLGTDCCDSGVILQRESRARML